MTEPEETNEEIETTADAPIEAEASTDEGTIIRDTDIVFDCPHCGHNLAIDYRGAGLQIECVNCGESVLVPIPDGMKIDDLDIEPGEILKQLFAARRNLQRAETRIEELELELRDATMRSDSLRALLGSFARRLEELKELSRNEVKLRDKSAALVNRLVDDIETTVGDTAHGEMPAQQGSNDHPPAGTEGRQLRSVPGSI